MNVQQFFKTFPDDNACLEHLFKQQYSTNTACPKCGEAGKFRKLSGIPAYTCNCGHHIHPMVGTPFENSRTPLQKWFYAMYLFTTSRHGVPAKELQRQLGVTYKCAWRIGHEIRKYMGTVDGNAPLSGIVEADEAYVGGKSKGKTGRGATGKTIVFGMVERGGNVRTQVMDNIRIETQEAIISDNVEKGSTMHTDEFYSTPRLNKIGYQHETVRHSSKKYVRGNVHTNSIEGFWAILKRSIKGTHVHVSKQHLDKYLGEFEYRYNMRKRPNEMFSRLVEAF